MEQKKWKNLLIIEMGHRLSRIVYTLQYKWVWGFFPFLHRRIFFPFGLYSDPSITDWLLRPQLAAFSQWSNTYLVDGLNEIKLILNTRWCHNNIVYFTLKPNYFLACHDIFVSHFMCSFYGKPSQTKLERCDCTKAVNKQQRLQCYWNQHIPNWNWNNLAELLDWYFLHQFSAKGGRPANKFLKLKIRKCANPEICIFADLNFF